VSTRNIDSSKAIHLQRHERRQLLERFLSRDLGLRLLTLADSGRSRDHYVRSFTNHACKTNFDRALDTIEMTDETAVVTETGIDEVIAIVAVQDPPITARDVTLAR
jgi:hypothetical protein